jgi:hypothetical protein
MFSISHQYISGLAPWRIFHKPPTVEFQTADIFIAHPYMNMRRFEVIFPYRQQNKTALLLATIGISILEYWVSLTIHYQDRYFVVYFWTAFIVKSHI